MKWSKQQSGTLTSISSDTHSAHRSLLPDKFFITVNRRKPEFKKIGEAKNFQEAIAMCEADYEANK